MNLFPCSSTWKYTRSMRSRNFLSLRSRSLFSRLRNGFFVLISCQFWFCSPPPHQRVGSLAGRGYVYNQRYPCLTGHTHHAKDRLACWVVRFNFKCFFCLDASSLPVSASPLWHIYASCCLVLPYTAYELHRAGLSSMSRVAVSFCAASGVGPESSSRREQRCEGRTLSLSYAALFVIAPAC